MSATRTISLSREASRLAALITRHVAAVGVLVALAIPVGYLITSYQYEGAQAASIARTGALRVSRQIYGNSVMWRYEGLRLEELLRAGQDPQLPVQQRLLDNAGNLVVAVGSPPPAPVLTRAVPVRDGRTPVGSLEVVQSLRPVLVQGGWILLLGVLLGILIFAAGRVLPLRILGATFQRLEASQEELHMAHRALEQSDDAVFIADADGTVRYVNPAFERTSGHLARDTVGRDWSQLGGMLGGPELQEAVWASLARGEIWKGRHTGHRKDGTPYETEATYSPVRDGQGQIAHYLAVQKDVTHQVRMEAVLRQAQRLEALGTLAGGIAHDINNILVPIIGYAELLERQLDHGGKEGSYVKVIHGSALRARDLVAQVLLFSRKAESRREPIDLRAVAREVVKLVSSTLPKNVSVRGRFPREPALVMANPTQMHQVLMNLCVNGAQAMPEGGELTVSLERMDLAGLLSYNGRQLSGDYVCLAVSDTGVGMDEQVSAHLFEPFFTTKGAGKGTGLGLSMVHGIVQQHGGDVKVGSVPGKGTTFALYLPGLDGQRPAADPPAAAPPAARPPEEHGSESVLYVDDESSVATLAKLLLEQLGYRVTTVTDGKRALEVFTAEPQRYDLVITDQVMPGISGDKLAVQMHRLRPGLPVILCSGYSDPLTPEQAEAIGIAALLHKPFDAGDLGRLVRRVLDAR